MWKHRFTRSWRVVVWHSSDFVAFSLSSAVAPASVPDGPALGLAMVGSGRRTADDDRRTREEEVADDHGDREAEEERRPKRSRRASEEESTGQEEPEVPRPQVWVMYYVRCPVGGCSRASGVLAKKPSEAEARFAVQHLVVHSPYHQMSQGDANNLAATCEVDCWSDATVQGEEVVAAAKRPRPPSAPPPGFLQSSCSSGSAGPCTTEMTNAMALSVLRLQRPASETVTMSRVQLSSCIDALRRARNAATAAGTLCAKAARVFEEEAAAIRECEEVMGRLLD